MHCDPGIDDALAIVFGCGHPGLDLAGLTTVSGNVDLGKVTANALSVLELAGQPGVPVTAGSARPADGGKRALLSRTLNLSQPMIEIALASGSPIHPRGANVEY